MLLVIVAIVGMWWALLVPPFQTPDSTAQFAYTQSLAENFRLPGDTGRPTYSTDQRVAAAAVGAGLPPLWPGLAPQQTWSAAHWRRFREETRAHPPARGNGGGPNPADANPPLYYLYAAIGYLIDSGGNALGRLYSIQLWGIFLLLLTTVGGWLLAGETFGHKRLAQLACASVVGLLPMTVFVSTSVNPDSMLITVWTFALWLGARVINRSAAAVDSVALCAVGAAAILIKATGYALVLPVALALVIGWLRRPRSERRRHLLVIGLASLVLLLPVAGWIAFTQATGRLTVNAIPTSAAKSAATTVATTPNGPVTQLHLFNVGDFLSYLWQFYLPALPFMPKIPLLPDFNVYEVWLKQAPAGIFGWLAVYMPAWIYPAVGGVVAGVLATAVALLTRVRNAQPLRLLGFYVCAVVALLGLLHLNDWRIIVAGSPPFLQGRYLLPVIGILGLCVGLIVTKVPTRFSSTVCGLTVAAVLGLEVVALVTNLQAYYL